jgi:hypothetical protein
MDLLVARRSYPRRQGMMEVRISRRERIVLMIDRLALELPQIRSGVLVLSKDNALPMGAAIQALVAFKNVKKTLPDGLTFKHKMYFAPRVCL